MKRLEVFMSAFEERPWLLTMGSVAAWGFIYLVLVAVAIAYGPVGNWLLALWSLVAIFVTYYVTIRMVRVHDEGSYQDFSNRAFFVAATCFALAVYYGLLGMLLPIEGEAQVLAPIAPGIVLALGALLYGKSNEQKK